MTEERFQVTPLVPLTFQYNYRVGEYLERYLQGLAERKILGIRCPECKRVLVPPRSACGQCAARPDQWVELKPLGTVENFTVAHVSIDKGEIRDLPAPAILALIRIEGADSLLMARVENLNPGECRIGLRVRAVWKDKPEGNVHDLNHFEPAA